MEGGGGRPSSGPGFASPSFSSPSAPMSGEASKSAQGTTEEGVARGTAFRGRGASRGRRGVPSIRGAAGHSGRGKPFGNRSAVFNKGPEQGTHDPRFVSEQDDPTVDDIGPSAFTTANLMVHRFEAGQQDDSVTGSDPPEVSLPTRLAHGPAAQVGNVDEAHSQKLNALGGSKENDDERKQRFESMPKQNRFFEMRSQRDTLRAKYIREGVLPDPDKPTDLAEAKTLNGTCTEMCPEFEREEREFQNEGDVLEMFPGTNRIDPRLAVKIYRRPAAGRELPLPEDVRPPQILRMTLDYLLHTLLPSEPDSTAFAAVQPFMWNRTRAIRQDFIVQGERGALAIECHERIARYHILCLHWRGGVGAEGWSEQQELEQLRKTIRSLTEFYEDLRRKQGTVWPNEAEFRSYNLLLHMQDPETLREVEALPAAAFDSPIVQAALKLRAYAQRSNNVVRRGRPLNTEATMNLWTRFFAELRRNDHVTYLLACLAENTFSQVRAGALKALAKTYLSQHAPLPLGYLTRSLGHDSDEEARTFAVELGADEAFDADGRLIGIRLGKVSDDKALPVAPFSNSIVEAKRRGSTCQDIVDGRTSNAAPLIASDHLDRSVNLPSSVKVSDPSIVLRPAASTPMAQLPSLPPASKSTLSTPTPAYTAKMNTPPSSTLSAKAPSFFPPASSAIHATTAPAFGVPPSKVSSTQVPATTTTGSPPSSARASSNAGLVPSPLVPAAWTPASPVPVALAAKSDVGSLAAKAPPQASPKPLSNTGSVNGATASSKPIVAVALRPPSAPSTTLSPPTRSSFSSTKADQAPKRTLHSVAQALFGHMLSELVIRKVRTVGEQACLRENRLRCEEARVRLVKDSADMLATIAFDDVLEEQVWASASVAVALELRMKKLKSWAMSKWRDGLGRARERHRQSARLRSLRAQLQTRRPQDKGGKESPDSVVKRPVLMEMDDNSLHHNLARAREARNAIWMPSSFLWALAAHVEHLLVHGIEQWTAALSVPDTGSLSSQWLRVKLSIDHQPHAEIVLRSDACVHMMDLQSCSAADLEAERDLGLVLFEVDARLADDASNVALWEEQRTRLQSLTTHDVVQQSRFLPKLLVICWTAEHSSSSDADLKRKIVLRNLGLGATGSVRHSWSKIELWEVAGTDVTPQHRFEAHLDALLQPLEWNKHRQTITFEDVQSTCSSSWRTMLDCIDACMARLASVDWSYDTVPNEAFDLVKLAFQTVTFLTRRVLDDVISVSELVSDENAASESMPIAVPHHDLSGDLDRSDRRALKQAAFVLALSQLGMLEHTPDGPVDATDISLIRAWLIERHAPYDQSTFAWAEYFGQLLQVFLVNLHSTWIESTLPTVQEIEAQVQPSTALHLQAAREIEWKTRILLRDGSGKTRPSHSDQTDKKRRSEARESLGDRPTAKMRRMGGDATNDMTIASPTLAATSSSDDTRKARPAPSAIDSLRTLIASANQLLDQGGGD